MPRSDTKLFVRVLLETVLISAVTTSLWIGGLLLELGEPAFLGIPIVGVVVWLVRVFQLGSKGRWAMTIAGAVLGTLLGSVVDAALVFAAFVLGGFGMAHGRPQRSGTRPRLRLGARRLGTRRVSTLRSAVAWARDARLEAEAELAFVELARRLRAAGAPASLVSDAERFAGDERRHAAVCAAVASRAAGRELEFAGGRPSPEISHVDLARLAVDSLDDACLGEAFAAASLRGAAQTTHDRMLATLLDSMAADEAAHAEHGWAVLDFCLAAGGSRVRRAVARRLEVIARRRPTRLGPPSHDAATWGRPSEARSGTTFDTTRAQVLRRAMAQCGIAATAVPAHGPTTCERPRSITPASS